MSVPKWHEALIGETFLFGFLAIVVLLACWLLTALGL